MADWDDLRVMRQVASEAVQPLRGLLERILAQLESINATLRRAEAARSQEKEQ